MTVISTNYVVKTTEDAREELIRITPEGNGKFLIRIKPERHSRFSFTADYDTLIALQYVLSVPDVSSLATATRNSLHDRTDQLVNLISSVLLNESPKAVRIPADASAILAVSPPLSNAIGEVYVTPSNVDF